MSFPLIYLLIYCFGLFIFPYYSKYCVIIGRKLLKNALEGGATNLTIRVTWEAVVDTNGLQGPVHIQYCFSFVTDNPFIFLLLSYAFLHVI